MVRAVSRLVLLALLLSASACHKAVTIRSEPSGARIRVNGVDKGKTPVTVSLEANIFVTHNVELQLDGYRAAHAPIPGEGNVGVAICGYLICPPLIIFARGPVSEAIFVLTPFGPGGDTAANGGLAPPPPPPPPPPPVADAVTAASEPWVAPAPAPTPMPRPSGKGPVFIKTKKAGLQEVVAGKRVAVTLVNGDLLIGELTAVAEYGVVLKSDTGERVLAAGEIAQIRRPK